MRTSPEIDKIAPELVAALAEVPAVNRTRRGIAASGDEYLYADLADDLAALKPALAAHDIAVLQESITTPSSVRTITRFLHGSGQFMETGSLVLELLSVGVQDVGGIIQYGRRYQLEAFAGMSAQHDDDAAAAQRAQTASKRPPQAGPPARPVSTASPQAASPRGSSPAPCRPPKRASKASIGRLKRAIAAVGMKAPELSELLNKHKVADLAALGQDVASQLIDALEKDATAIAARVTEEGSAS